MKAIMLKSLVFSLCLGIFIVPANAQRTRNAQKRTSQTTTNEQAAAAVQPVVDTIPVTTQVDSLPIQQVKKSLRPNSTISDYNSKIKDLTPLQYEDLRESDAMYRQVLWREIDTREKMNQPFRYAADEDNGNQRFISILFKAVQDGDVTAFSSIDDRFTTPMTIGEVAKTVSGGETTVPLFDSLGNISGYKTTTLEVNLDSFYRFRIKEEVIFDRESSRLFWRILGIAPVKSIITSEGINLGETALFWVYYPDMRPIFTRYEVFNGKNMGARMTWEELFESRMFSGRIIKSTLDNPYDQFLDQKMGLKDRPMRQLYEGENIKNKIFNYEQNVWEY